MSSIYLLLQPSAKLAVPNRPCALVSMNRNISQPFCNNAPIEGFAGHVCSVAFFHYLISGERSKKTTQFLDLCNLRYVGRLTEIWIWKLASSCRQQNTSVHQRCQIWFETSLACSDFTLFAPRPVVFPSFKQELSQGLILRVPKEPKRHQGHPQWRQSVGGKNVRKPYILRVPDMI